MSGTSGARRISPAASRAAAGRSEPGAAKVEPVLGSAFVSVCATVLLAALFMAIILAMRAHNGPVPAYAIFGSGLFAAVFASFLVGALHLALTDSRRNKDKDH